MRSSNQKLVALTVDPFEEHDVTERLNLEPGWSIQQVSISPHGDNAAMAVLAVVLVKPPGNVW